jgi:hypothetical protein
MVIVWLALGGATLVVGLLVALVYVTARGGSTPDLGTVIRWAVKLWVINLVLELAILYFAEPALTGPYWGGQWLLLPLLLTGGLAFFGSNLTQVRSALDSFAERVNGTYPLGAISRTSRAQVVKETPAPGTGLGPAPASSSLAGAIALGLVVALALFGNGAITIATTWFNPNAQQLAAIPHIIVEPTSASLPSTDVNHIVLVSHGVAAYLGQQVLASSHQNLGSLYHTDLQDYTLQSVAGHLYWIAPLIYNNVWANLGNWESPGFVAVDAEDPNVAPTLHTGLHMRYLPGALFNQDLLRHVYLSGYTNANLADPTLEVNDSWKPYYTISLMAPTRGFTGDVVKRVLLVDPQNGVIQNIASDRVPSWVDRVIPASTVLEYLQWWGEYAHAPWFNPSGAKRQVPAIGGSGQAQLLYDRVGQQDEPVWLVPMTSGASTDNASTGIVLFDARDNTGRLYPISGIGVTANVESTLASNPANTRGDLVSNIQLYEIYGEPTWLATFYQPNPYGEIFQAVGIVDARHLSGSNVIMASNKEQALARYAQWLSDNGIQTGKISPTGTEVSVQSKVLRISSAVQGGTTVYTMLLAGQPNHIFQAGLPLSPELPLVQPGDTIEGTYLDTGENSVTFTSFSDLSLPLATPTPGTETPSPGT